MSDLDMADDETTAMRGVSLNSGSLHVVAKQAYLRTKDAPNDTTPDQTDAIVAMLFSAATLEAFISDLAQLANFGKETLKGLPSLRAFVDVMAEVESGRGSVLLKYILAKLTLSGDPYDKGAQPYQDFALLSSLRDSIVHLKPIVMKLTPAPPSYEDKWEKLVQALETRKLCEKRKGESEAVQRNALAHISTRAVARWSCNVVVDMIDSIREGLPIDHGAQPQALFHVWTTGFTRVE